ncbi:MULTISPECIES: hypothetical protein [Burkholderia]|uniref:hypothetical protein n=1 Tax=Burkholderia TaxID=32008 RepID=UPI0011B21F83|nr:hypothetical protein [Burkholderia multivorans]MBU9163600.1 hypothetical protein [Burkholderia multivorans]MBU9263796.1 hypothetical protein [Burkholderia multivorans]MBU9491569.1 hypothetical protein [Burkholderia multivorans]MBU9545801.1 hypothetical protein [Burkholderia multivorans]MCA8177427.1 hypothetical protein [Burkholderia multivorans]
MNTHKQVRGEAVRQKLLESSKNLIDGTNALSETLRGSFPGIKLAFVVDCIPEQGEDIYRILVNSTTIAEVEIARGVCSMSNPPRLKTIELSVYQQKRHSRAVRETLEVALDLMKSGGVR